LSLKWLPEVLFFASDGQFYATKYMKFQRSSSTGHCKKFMFGKRVAVNAHQSCHDNNYDRIDLLKKSTKKKEHSHTAHFPSVWKETKITQ
jgi:hypothetical protein